MSEFDWKGLVRKVAPTVATALGGPLAGVATSALSEILLGRSDGTEGEIETVLASGKLTGEQIVRMKELDNELKIKEKEMGVTFAELEFKETQAYLADVQNARQRQIDLHDNIPQVILACASLVYVFQFAIFIFWHLPTDEFVRALIVRGFGTIDGVLLTCVAYFVGSSKGSARSGDSVRRIAEDQAKSAAKVAESAAKAAEVAATR